MKQVSGLALRLQNEGNEASPIDRGSRKGPWMKSPITSHYGLPVGHQGGAAMVFRVLFTLPSVLLFVSLVALSSPAQAQGSVTVEQLECLPLEENGVATANVAGESPGSRVRLYFRRMHHVVEDFYYVEMLPTGGGNYEGVFPESEDREPKRFELRDGEDTEYEWADWWREKEASDHRNPNGDLDDDLIRERASVGKLESRAWMEGLTDEDFQEWLEDQKQEPAEYYVALYDSYGNLQAKSDMRAVPIWPKDDCEVRLTERQESVSMNMTVGETAEWQIGEDVFHWLCDGIVTRVDFEDLYRADERCRACVIAWWLKPQYIVPAVITAGATGFVILDDDDDGDPGAEISPSRP